MANKLEDHYQGVIDELIKFGELVIPFIGAGVNLCGRGVDTQWEHNCGFLPSGAELSEFLAKEFRYPLNDRNELLRVSQYVAEMKGTGPLYGVLRRLFDSNSAITPVHNFFAHLPAALRERGSSIRHLLIVTTNYDDVMERAFREANEPFDVVVYESKYNANRGKFLHRRPGCEEFKLIERANKYEGLDLEESSIVLKIHGTVDQGRAARGSFVITEDDYIDYLTHSDLSTLFPVNVLDKLKNSHFLFLGYALRDWNVRLILKRIIYERENTYSFWAVMRDPDALDKKFWERRSFDIIETSLEEYFDGLSRHLGLG